MSDPGTAGSGTPVGSVAEEAARLVDAFAGWAADSGLGQGSHRGHDEPDADGGCGAATGVGQAAACRVCPVCQGIALLRSVRPETVDRLADLAAAAAATLRDLAASRRDADAAPAQRGRDATVQDIPVDDGDDHHHAQHEHHDGRDGDRDDVNGDKEPLQ